jgi:hypothetical protein
LCKTNVFLILNLTERTILTDKVVFKGSKWNFFSLRDQYKTTISLRDQNTN